ncbi:MAG: glycosyltransferase family 2 protein [Blastocatellia bacterium]
MSYSLKHKIGAMIYDLPQFVWAMRPARKTGADGAPWVRYRNRNERLLIEPGQRGVACDWQWTSDLHIAKVFPALGLRLMKRAFADWPITLQPKLEMQTAPADVSFIIGHRGQARLPHLLLTLQSIAAQRGVTFECIVVEQSARPEIQSALPAWVRYVHTPLPQADMPYCRSWAFNVGAKMAQGALLVLHDNDLLVPSDYAAQLMKRFDEGYEVVNLKRFIFYLNEAHTGRMLATQQLLLNEAPEAIVQNAQGGGSIAIARDAYFAIGGFDESFVGWGGEDNEFWERALTRRLWPYGYLPLVHLWHAAQPGKHDGQRQTAELLEQLYAIPASQRIANLIAQNFASNYQHPSR